MIELSAENTIKLCNHILPILISNVENAIVSHRVEFGLFRDKKIPITKADRRVIARRLLDRECEYPSTLIKGYFWNTFWVKHLYLYGHIKNWKIQAEFNNDCMIYATDVEAMVFVCGDDIKNFIKELMKDG